MNYSVDPKIMPFWNTSSVVDWLDLRGETSGYCIQAIGLVKSLEELGWPLLGLHEARGKTLGNSHTANELYALIELGLRYNLTDKLKISYNPYLNSFIELLKEVKEHFFAQGSLIVSRGKVLDFSICFLREMFFTKEIKLMKYKQFKAYRSRVKSAREYIQYLRKSYSRILCVRVDLSYRKGMFLQSDSFSEQMRKVKCDWERMRCKLKSSHVGTGMIGYMLKLEFAQLKGFHYHALVFYNGSQRQQDVVLGKMLGEFWAEDVVTNNNGRYYNCNRHKHRYRNVGIGSINYYEEDKYRNLMDLVVNYMIKPDDVLDFIGPNKRFFFKGVMKNDDPSTMGRPRKKTICP